MSRRFDWLIVGAGFTGAVLAERIASQLGKRVLVIDRRAHIAGNAFDGPDASGVMIHHYGPHLFHTNSQQVWEYLSRFTNWRAYSHHVQAEVDGKLVPVPFNLNSLTALFPQTQAERLRFMLIDRYGRGARVPVLQMLEENTGMLHELARFVYDNVLLGYTLKHWGLKPDELARSVTARVPIVVSEDNRYFADTYQAIPAMGYSVLIENILAHENITVELNSDYRDVVEQVEFERMVFTGPIDEFFDYAHGPLPYRSLRFEYQSHQQPLVQPIGQINYPNTHEHTRSLEFKHFTGQQIGCTTTSREYPCDYTPGVNEPFYPIPRDENRQRFSQYRKLAEQLNGRVVFAGRLADYQYYNMDQVVARALTVFSQEIMEHVDGMRRGGDTQSQSVAA